MGRPSSNERVACKYYVKKVVNGNNFVFMIFDMLHIISVFVFIESTVPYNIAKSRRANSASLFVLINFLP